MCQAGMQEVHITKQIFPSHVVAFRIANSKLWHYCRNTGETMPPGIAGLSGVLTGLQPGAPNI